MNHSPRDLPQIDALLGLAGIDALVRRYSRAETVAALRAATGALRARMLAGQATVLPDFTAPEFAETVAGHIAAARRPAMHRVVNATGILIHTNLGRAPLAEAALAAVAQAGAAPATLEYDIVTGGRGARHDHVRGLICDLTGADDALVVNNCAAAVLLALTATARGRGVIASRGELIEIGGSFRMPDVIAQSGARLIEVGTTNRTRTGDYANAIDDDTAVLLKSHTSNFRVVGFAEAPARAELAALARARGLILIEDLGSGVLVDLARFGLREEPVVGDVLRAGVDLVLFSGDKLLGGPQAGIIAGRADVIQRLGAHPLARALRIDKLSLAALAATLRLYLPPHDPLRLIPVLRMLSQPADTVRQRAETLAAMLPRALKVAVCATAAQAGAGSLPQQDLPSFGLRVNAPGLSPDALAARLRGAETPIIGRVARGAVVLDMRGVEDHELPLIRTALGAPDIA
ncbi:MAG: L-seryl-tRNA(Sec) selenium transferase [Rhodobacteraceae bacterium]|nr:L-seryl-tRNA(Sec) selenium transferase [Paracoccaceae bacterium]